jgi:hypothetical protein
MFYEFDDISNTLVKSEVKSDKFDLTVFGFKCGLIDQIIKLINRVFYPIKTHGKLCQALFRR